MLHNMRKFLILVYCGLTASIMYFMISRDYNFFNIYNRLIFNGSDDIPEDSVQRRPVMKPVKSQACKVTQPDPWDARILSRVVVHQEMECKGKPPLTYVDNEFLRINGRAIASYPEGIGKCVYYPFESRTYKKYAVTFREAVPVQEEFIRVECFGKETGKKMYVNFHGLFPRKLRTEKRVWEVSWLC